mmetsp:Transcript_66129/g.166779  ORF Transcript_66129/g.166779 Transcript_66129/m.166779 type:complete len:454 (+) Transcript_66129:129-1490(+)
MSTLSKSRAVTIRKDDGRRMEDEARRMEAKLDMLRKTLDSEQPAKGASGGRWSSGSASKPLRNGYVKGVLEAPKAPAGAGRARAQPRASLSGSNAGSGAATPVGTEGVVSDLVASAGAAALRATGGDAGSPAAAEGGSGGRAASNLQAAMAQQSQDSQEVESFLAGLKLDRYVSIFMDHGFDSMDVVMEMQESHMREIGMAVGHILKLQKRLAELRPPVPEKPTVASVVAQSPMNASGRRVTFGGTEATATPKASASGQSGSLASGNFDEAESAASFQEALRAWREGGAEAKKPAAAEGAKPAGGSFWSSVGGAEMDLVRCSTPVRSPTEAAAVDSETQSQQRDPAPSEEKLCCYNCFKQFYKSFAVERSSPLDAPSTPGGVGRLPAGNRRLLCSEACADRWVASMEEKAAAQRKRQEKLETLKEAQRLYEEQQRLAECGDAVVGAEAVAMAA